jgi:hypothetical protein
VKNLYCEHKAEFLSIEWWKIWKCGVFTSFRMDCLLQINSCSILSSEYPVLTWSVWIWLCVTFTQWHPYLFLSKVERKITRTCAHPFSTTWNSFPCTLLNRTYACSVIFLHVRYFSFSRLRLLSLFLCSLPFVFWVVVLLSHIVHTFS